MTLVYMRILIALGLGIALGAERTFAHKTAGMRTYGLVSMGACLFVMLSQIALPANASISNVMYIAAAVVTGIGFLCGGVIIFQNHHLSGLTTAAGLWLTAGIGMAVGFGQVPLATFVTVVTLVVFTILWFIEQVISKLSKRSR
ncbi:MgtC/SapB family protein [Candidatus Parcubacteria bacterium]|nr:MgtC/SapB family protein [Candidatus Parcubacteria bacterium]